MAEAEAEACPCHGGSMGADGCPHTQLCWTIGALSEPCQVVLALVGTHTCAVQMVLVPLPSGTAEGSTQGVHEHPVLGIATATFRRGARGPGSPQGAQGNCLCLELGNGSSVRSQQVQTSLVHKVGPTHPCWSLFLHISNSTLEGRSFTKYLRPNSALSPLLWRVKSKIWITQL